MASVYVLHISPRYRHAAHYIGFTEGLVHGRIGEHYKGNGSPLIKAALLAGCTVTIAHIFQGASRTFERRLKNRADTVRWCPCCGVNTRPLPTLTDVAA